MIRTGFPRVTHAHHQLQRQRPALGRQQGLLRLVRRSRTPTCCACRKPRRRNTSSARAAAASVPDGYQRWFRDATTKKGYSGVAIYAQARARRGAHRARLGGVRRRRPLHRGALRQPERGVAVRAVGLVGRGAPGVQVQGDGVAHADLRPVAGAAAATTCCAATGTSCTRALDIRNWKSNQKNSGCLPAERDWLNGVLRRRRAAGSTLSRAAPRRPGLHLVEQSRRGAREERRLAHRLPGRARRRCATGCRLARSIRSRASPTTRPSSWTTPAMNDACRGRGPPSPRKPSVWKAFTQPAAWTMFFFGFSSGLPFLLVAGTLAYWLKDNGIELKEITIIASAGMTYALKFLWAPLLDHARLPGCRAWASAAAGCCSRRWAWSAGLLAMALVDAGAAGVSSSAARCWWRSPARRRTSRSTPTASRSRRPPAQGALVATYSLGYRIALIVTGAFALDPRRPHALADRLPGDGGADAGADRRHAARARAGGAAHARRRAGAVDAR